MLALDRRTLRAEATRVRPSQIRRPQQARICCLMDTAQRGDTCGPPRVPRMRQHALCEAFPSVPRYLRRQQRRHDPQGSWARTVHGRRTSPKVGVKKPKPHKDDPETRLFELLDRVWREKVSVKSNYARSNAEVFAMAASMGFITTQTGVATFASGWQITTRGLSALNEKASL
jgi:hypothetical protein